MNNIEPKSLTGKSARSGAAIEVRYAETVRGVDDLINGSAYRSFARARLH